MLLDKARWSRLPTYPPGWFRRSNEACRGGALVSIRLQSDQVRRHEAAQSGTAFALGRALDHGVALWSPSLRDSFRPGPRRCRAAQALAHELAATYDLRTQPAANGGDSARISAGRDSYRRGAALADRRADHSAAKVLRPERSGDDTRMRQYSSSSALSAGDNQARPAGLLLAADHGRAMRQPSGDGAAACRGIFLGLHGDPPS